MEETVSVCFVTGHRFGREALLGLQESIARGANVDVVSAIGLDPLYARRTVGYARIDDLVPAELFIETSDGSLRAMSAQIADSGADLIVVVGWSRLVALDVLEAMPGIDGVQGIGMHPTNLPIGRGRAPIPWTIIKGLRTSALTVFELAAEADAGPIIAKYPVTISPQETSESLFATYAELHNRAGRDLGRVLDSRRIPSTDQDHGRATFWSKRTDGEGLLTPNMTRKAVDAHVRAMLGPYPRAWVVIEGRRHEVVSTDFHGPVREAMDSVRFQCSDGALTLMLRSP